MRKFFKEFKEFISRGNVLDLAVGVIIGGAFSAIVTALTTYILQPIINWVIALIVGGDGICAYTFLRAISEEGTLLTNAEVHAGAAVDMAASIYIDWGAFIAAIINFILIALVLFLIIKAINNAQKASAGKYNGYTKEEYKKMRKEGLSKAQIEEKAKARDEEAAKLKAEADAEAYKNSTEGLLKDIKELLEKQAK